MYARERSAARSAVNRCRRFCRGVVWPQWSVLVSDWLGCGNSDSKTFYILIFCSLFLHFAFGQVSSQLLQALWSRCATSVAEYQCTRPQEFQTTRVVLQTTRPETTKALQCDQMGSVFVSDRRGCGKHVSKTFSNSTKLFCKQGA